MYNKRAIGSDKETHAINYLTDHKYIILERNYFTRRGEIDIIALDQNYLVFIEVKFRSSTKKGLPEDAISLRKQHSIINAAKYYLYRHGISFDTPCRFDVIVILDETITLYKNAFDITGNY